MTRHCSYAQFCSDADFRSRSTLNYQSIFRSPSNLTTVDTGHGLSHLKFSQRWIFRLRDSWMWHRVVWLMLRCFGETSFLQFQAEKGVLAMERPALLQYLQDHTGPLVAWTPLLFRPQTARCFLLPHLWLAIRIHLNYGKTLQNFTVSNSYFTQLITMSRIPPSRHTPGELRTKSPSLSDSLFVLLYCKLQVTRCSRRYTTFYLIKRTFAEMIKLRWQHATIKQIKYTHNFPSKFISLLRICLILSQRSHWKVFLNPSTLEYKMRINTPHTHIHYLSK
jgi:hypothetical protein